jgi:hypothetical protein
VELVATLSSGGASYVRCDPAWAESGASTNAAVIANPAHSPLLLIELAHDGGRTFEKRRYASHIQHAAMRFHAQPHEVIFGRRLGW